MLRRLRTRKLWFVCLFARLTVSLTRFLGSLTVSVKLCFVIAMRALIIVGTSQSQGVHRSLLSQMREIAVTHRVRNDCDSHSAGQSGRRPGERAGHTSGPAIPRRL